MIIRADSLLIREYHDMYYGHDCYKSLCFYCQEVESLVAHCLRM